MSKQLKPVTIYAKPHIVQFRAIASKELGDIKWLCLPLTPASRKAMIDAMAKMLIYEDSDNDGDGTYEQKAEAALSALEKMAGEKA